VLEPLRSKDTKIVKIDSAILVNITVATPVANNATGRSLLNKICQVVPVNNIVLVKIGDRSDANRLGEQDVRIQDNMLYFRFCSSGKNYVQHFVPYETRSLPKDSGGKLNPEI